MIKINNKVYTGNNLQIRNSQIFINGKQVNLQEDETIINIIVEGSIETLDIDYCDKL